MSELMGEIRCDRRAPDADGAAHLFGPFSIADAMYAPVVSRLATHTVALDGPEAADEPWTMTEQELAIA